MVFDIPGTKNTIRIVATFKLTEDVFEGFFEDTGLYTQTAPVGHAENNFTTTLICNQLHQLV